MGALDVVRALLGSSRRSLDDAATIALRADLGDPAFATAAEQGRSLSFDEIIAYALAPSPPPMPQDGPEGGLPVIE